MSVLLHHIIAKHVKSEFEHNWQPDGTRTVYPYSMYDTFPEPGEDFIHPGGDPHPTHDNFMWQVVDRDKYPAETGGQGELDTVDNWLDVGNHYFVLEPALENGAHDLPKENLNYFQDYIQNERAGSVRYSTSHVETIKQEELDDGLSVSILDTGDGKYTVKLVDLDANETVVIHKAPSIEIATSIFDKYVKYGLLP